MMTKHRDKTSFTILEMEAALCAWEHMCESRDVAPFADHFEDHGSAAMRHVSIQAGAVALAVYDHMQAQGYEFTMSYDWEFVPAVLLRLDWRALINDNQYNGPAYEPDVAAIFASIFAASEHDFTKAHKSDHKDKWMATARRDREQFADTKPGRIRRADRRATRAAKAVWLNS